MDKIGTDTPYIKNRPHITREIARFWNQTSAGFRAVWGPHIHHGYFESRHETPLEAQEKLIEKLIGIVDLPPRGKILDAGCGMGGSSLYLAKNYGVEVEGISLSQRQVDIANEAAKNEGVRSVHFKVEDALSLASFADNTFDMVWSLESCEQFYDKGLFLQQAFRVLKPGGALMLATWCSGAEEYKGLEAKKYKKLCTAFQLPYMPTISHYAKLLQQQGFAVRHVLNWSEKVKDTWKIGIANARAYSLFKIFMMSGWRGLLFLKDARLMHQGFEEGRVEYGVFAAIKPSTPAA